MDTTTTLPGPYPQQGRLRIYPTGGGALVHDVIDAVLDRLGREPAHQMA